MQDYIHACASQASTEPKIVIIHAAMASDWLHHGDRHFYNTHLFLATKVIQSLCLNNDNRGTAINSTGANNKLNIVVNIISFP
jgi:hypothetical protein